MSPKKAIFQEGLFRAGATNCAKESQYRPVVDFCSIPNGLGETGQAKLSSRCVAIKSHSPSQGNLSLSLLFILWLFHSKVVKQTDKTIHCCHAGSRCTYNNEVIVRYDYCHSYDLLTICCHTTKADWKESDLKWHSSILGNPFFFLIVKSRSK